MAPPDWHDLGTVEALSARAVTPVMAGRLRLAVSFRDGEFGVIHGACSHVGGPLGEGTLDGDYLVCPWHHWKYHRCTGKGEPGYEGDAVPRYEVRVREGRVEVDLAGGTRRTRLPHEPHPVAREVEREPGPPRVLGISTTNMEGDHPRYSTSEALLEHGLAFAQRALGTDTRLIRLRELSFRACEGFYSKSAHACTWPCSITQMDPEDQLDRVYEGVVHWADVVLLATPIRWGNASALYYRMIERLNCIQNQVTIANRVLLRNKVASFIITGGQDNVQQVAGQLLGFFAEIGFYFPPFPYVAHSRGWTAEDMENNVREVQESTELREGTEQLVARAVDQALLLLDHEDAPHHFSRGGRKAHRLAKEG
ncbi:MAG: Rieske 2Fe-2S domain-containing protein [Gemmatimonadota bacterium]